MKKIVIGALGEDVHAAGIHCFSMLAREEGYEVVNLGSAIPIAVMLDTVEKENPDLIAISYRLNREGAFQILRQFLFDLEERELRKNRRFVFGGTQETCQVARELDLFEEIFDGSENEIKTRMYLRASKEEIHELQHPQSLRERVDWKSPYPLIRHHIGLDSLEETIIEVEKLAESELLDIISLAPDQNCQQYYFEPEKMDRAQDGAGGAPIRTEDDWKRLFQATRRGNFPLVRSYAGTNQLDRFVELHHRILNNAWSAIPITWYSDLDRRSERPLEEAIEENLRAIQKAVSLGVPVETNESHQWALRYCDDVTEIVTAYMGAFLAKQMGVKEYVQQMMLMTPPKLSPKMDLAKQIAKMMWIESLEDKNFRIYRMIRTGLLSCPADENLAKGNLIFQMSYGMALKPDIVHVVAFCEAKRRARADEILESVLMVDQAVLLANRGLPDPMCDPEVKERVEELLDQGEKIFRKIRAIGPLHEPNTLVEAIKQGILDAPALKGFSFAQGKVETVIEEGKCVRL
ncbi:hypothetical protein SANA_30140 [Gottschalkiaceae bacterium SANA]|nr:hypothetical protein SANA_30140 [Gottschalkiaceae bacterium SANA]